MALAPSARGTGATPTIFSFLARPVFLVDFGIAWPSDFVPVTPFEQELWQLGSYGYAPPEQYEEIGEPTPQLDLFSLGVLLQCMLTGENPADKPSGPEQLFQCAPAGPGLLRLLLASQLQQETRHRPPCACYVGQQLSAALRQHRPLRKGEPW